MPNHDSQRKPLLPTIALGIGVLLGGSISAAIGVMFGSESAVVVLYAVGMVAGAIAGGWIGSRISARRVAKSDR